jgi:hypothetical protein
VAVEADGARVEGEVIGAEVSEGANGEERHALLLRSSDAEVLLVDLARVRSVRLLDASSRADLAFFLDRRRAATSGDNRTVRVSITGRADDLRVSYVIPAPTWRVSYRLARSDTKTTLMAWGIVHNPADEDLQDIDLTLTTGQPVSFTIDLYNPKNVRRVVVEESSRALAAAPTQFERAPMPQSAPPLGGRPPPAPMPMRGPAAAPASFGFADKAASEPAGATFEDRGELFEYRVAHKVSLGRGSSAMVPLLACPIDAKKERIWRAGGGAAPDLVISFKNSSGAVLEEGPAVVYDDDVYAGEAMVPYSTRGAEVKLAFAKDLGVRCKDEQSWKTVVVGVRLTAGFLAQEQRREEHHELSAESDHAEPVEVTFELPKSPGRVLSTEHAQPFEETSSYRRFKATVPPRGKVAVRVVEQMKESVRYDYDKLTSTPLAWWLENRFLDKATFDSLAEVIAVQADVAELEAKRALVVKDQGDAYTKQTKITEQLEVLKDSGPEGELRLRYVKELQQQQDRVNACEREMKSLLDAAEAAKRRAEETLKKLVGS